MYSMVVLMALQGGVDAPACGHRWGGYYGGWGYSGYCGGWGYGGWGYGGYGVWCYAGDYVEAAIRDGTQVFKAHVQVGRYEPNDPLLDHVWGVIEDAGVPVVIHCGSGPVPGDYTGP